MSLIQPNQVELPLASCSSPADDLRVIAALEEYRAALEAGLRPDRERLLVRFEGTATDLAACLDALDFVHAVAPQLSRSGTGPSPVSGSEFALELAGTPLGDFRLIREVGRGGMGIVYEAEQLSLGRRVALKVLPFAAALDARQLQRFRNEAQAAAHLHHQHIVPVYAVGAERGVHYYAMQFIDGRTLAAAIDEQRQAAGRKLAASAATPVAAATTLRTTRNLEYVRSAAALGLQAAEALEHAHQLGVVHRDVKPANLIVDRRGHLWITDFGLAQFQKDTGLTLTGDLVGTLRYMSPEQARGQPALVDYRTDLYSLGASLYELLTLEPVFGALDRQELLHQIAIREPVPPRQLNKAIPAELETILLKALAKTPAERYATAQEMADDFRRFLEDKPIKARRPTPLQRLRRWARRHKPVVVTAAVALGLVLGLALVGLGVSIALVSRERDKALEAEGLATRRLYESLLREAQASRWSGWVGQSFKGLEALAEAAKLRATLDLGPEAVLDLRNEAVACMILPDLKPEPLWPGGPPSAGVPAGIAFAADGERFARFEPDGTITLRHLADYRVIVHLTDVDRPSRRRVDWRMLLRLSPDGKFLAARGEPRDGTPLQVWELAGARRVVRVPSGGQWNSHDVDFSPDRRLLAAGHPDGSICFYDLATAKPPKCIAPGPPPECLRFHPGGHQLAVARGFQVHILDMTGQPVTSALAASDAVRMVTWSSNGKHLAGCTDQQVYIWHLDTPGPPILCKGHSAAVIHVAFDARGDLLASTSFDGTTRLWDPWTGRPLLSADGVGADFSRDNRWLGLEIAGPKVGRWEVADGRECRRLYGPKRGQPISCVAASPDGHWLASTDEDGVRLWDLASGKLAAVLRLGSTAFVAFDPSGQSLLTAGDTGLYRWPLRPGRPASSGGVKVGPPTALCQPHTGVLAAAALSLDGRTLAVGGDHRFTVFDLEKQTEPSHVLVHSDLESVALSPDGRWVATGNKHGYEIKVWDARGGRYLRSFPGRTSRVAFSPDGKWLVIATAESYAFHEVDSWQLRRALARDGSALGPGPLVFSPDGQFLAFAESTRRTKVIDLNTWQELVSVEAPEREQVTGLCFSPAADRLAAATPNGVIQVWDLGRIRACLATMNLDWDLPPYLMAALAVPPGGGSEPPPVEVDLGGFSLGRQELANYRRAQAANPDSASENNNFAWFYVTGPADIRDPEKALPFARTAVRLAPKEADFLNTLGVVYYRLGRYDQAVQTSNDAVRARDNQPLPWDLFFLAMSHHKLGERAKARAAYAQALAWMDTHRPDDEELLAFRAEAMALLGP
jgi:serine/threonine protein kinase/WD40 repeat protein